ncbi:hypothetical protein PPERSA_08935 [Pseudocohnilembus persalinus]|uniref:ribonuclease Z n=1 Tax=Pseudocohnilembus persalinus TaxID=266149 RepID=A0A0V0R2T6_PSEPJ|nr:hypothetical protein PPERSA_08935 [Pseudocohnilembus persalinus]|eukprot:KRX08831.1 hypothetical protein PPERSA_08935 [Pseudocohnilembus persalinus]
MSEQFCSVTKPATYFFTQLQAENIAGIFCWCINQFSISGFNSKIYGPQNTVKFLENIKKSAIVGQYLVSFSAYEFFTQKKMLGIQKLQHFTKLVEKIDQNNSENLNSNQQEQTSNTEGPKFGKKFPIQYRNNKYLLENLKKNEIDDPSQYIKNDTYQDKQLKITPIQMNNILIPNQKPVLSYLITINEFQPQYNKEKLSVLSKLEQQTLFKKGQVEKDQKIYQKNDFLEPQKASPVILIIDCPQYENIDVLQSNFELPQFFEANINKQIHFLSTIIHITPKSVVKSQRYVEFFEKFGKTDVNHIFCDQSIIENPEIYFNLELSPLIENIENIFKNINSQKMFTPKKYCNFKIWPLNSQEKINQEPYQVQNGFQIEAKKYDYDSEFQNLYQNYVQLDPIEIDIKQPKIIFLGTASMVPASYRNVSSILVDMENYSIMLDCGEGTFAQFYERFQIPFQNKKEIVDQHKYFIQQLLKLQFIVISHHHEDHFMGVINLIKYRDNFLKEAIQLNLLSQQEYQQKTHVYLIIPANVYPFMYTYIDVVEKLNIKLVMVQSIMKNQSQEQAQNNQTINQSNEEFFQDQFIAQGQNLTNNQLKQLIQQNEIHFNEFQEQSKLLNFEILFTNVDHCIQSVGTLIHFKDIEKKISYSGDTRPCEEFINLSKNVDLMIHEATFISELQQNAITNKHSTVQEALQSGMKSNAKFTILTHFSQRYSKNVEIEKFDKEKQDEQLIKYYDNNTIYALDHLQVDLQNLKKAVSMSKCALRIKFDQENEKTGRQDNLDKV